MDNKTTAEPGVKDTAVQDSGRKESDMNESNQQDVEQTAGQDAKESATVQKRTSSKKKLEESENKEKRPAIRAREQNILDFLRGCLPYEADAIRVMTGFATGKGEVGDMDEADRKALNGFLNFGMKATANNAKDCRALRVENAAKLLQDLKDFLDKEQYVCANIALLTIAPDEKMIGEAVKKTPVRPDGVLPLV